MYPELITRPDIKVFLPPIGGFTAYICKLSRLSQYILQLLLSIYQSALLLTSLTSPRSSLYAFTTNVRSSYLILLTDLIVYLSPSPSQATAQTSSAPTSAPASRTSSTPSKNASAPPNAGASASSSISAKRDAH